MVSNTVVMSVSQEMNFNPAQVTFTLASDTLSAPARVVAVNGAKGNLIIQPLNSNWLSAAVSQQQITFSLTPAVSNLPPGVYKINVGVTDLAAKVTDSIPVTLNISASLASSVSALQLVASTGTATAIVAVSASGNGVLPLNITTPKWMTWT